MIRFPLLLTCMIALSGCQGSPSGGQGNADAATRAACQQRANQAYDQQNRAEIYSPPPTVNTPYTANYLPATSDRGLSDLFAHDRMINDCIRNTGTGTERSPASPPAGPRAAPPPAR